MFAVIPALNINPNFADVTQYQKADAGDEIYYNLTDFSATLGVTVETAKAALEQAYNECEDTSKYCLYTGFIDDDEDADPFKLINETAAAFLVDKFTCRGNAVLHDVHVHIDAFKRVMLQLRDCNETQIQRVYKAHAADFESFLDWANDYNMTAANNIALTFERIAQLVVDGVSLTPVFAHLDALQFAFIDLNDSSKVWQPVYDTAWQLVHNDRTLAKYFLGYYSTLRAFYRGTIVKVTLNGPKSRKLGFAVYQNDLGQLFYSQAGFIEKYGDIEAAHKKITSVICNGEKLKALRV